MQAGAPEMVILTLNLRNLALDSPGASTFRREAGEGLVPRALRGPPLLFLWEWRLQAVVQSPDAGPYLGRFHETHSTAPRKGKEGHFLSTCASGYVRTQI